MIDFEIKPPTCEDIFNEELGDPVNTENGSWRHGMLRTEVYHRDDDNTYWQAVYRVSSDGETNELREGYAQITRVYPHSVITTVYKSKPQEGMVISGTIG